MKQDELLINKKYITSEDLKNKLESIIKDYNFSDPDFKLILNLFSIIIEELEHDKKVGEIMSRNSSITSSYWLGKGSEAGDILNLIYYFNENDD